MTAVETLQAPKVKRLTDSVVPNRIETKVSKTPLEQYDRWRLAADERDRLKEPSEEQPLTMEEIVAIVKEVRAERYAKKQKNSTGS